MSGKLDLSPFRDALEELEKTYTRAMTPDIRADHEVYNVYRTAVVKGYEYTYSLSVKYIERFIEMQGTERITDDDINFRDLLRIALEYGIICDIDAWLDYRNNRNATSHGYQASIADRIFKAAPALIQDAHFTLSAIYHSLQGMP